MQSIDIENQAEKLATAIKAGARLRNEDVSISPRGLLARAHRIRRIVRYLMCYILAANIVLAIKISLFFSADFQAVDRMGRSYPLSVEHR